MSLMPRPRLLRLLLATVVAATSVAPARAAAPPHARSASAATAATAASQVSAPAQHAHGSSVPAPPDAAASAPSLQQARKSSAAPAAPAVATAVTAATSATSATPDTRWQRIDELVEEAMRDNKLHGAVVLVGQRDRVLYEKAFGFRAIEPQREPMTLDTIFDAASLTKVVATTTSAMLLLEQGRLRLSDRVSTYVPGFERYGKQDITIRHLMTHMSGLRPDIDWSFEWQGYDKAIELAIEEVPVAAPNE